MRKRVHLRTLTAEEVSEVKRLAASGKESIRLESIRKLVGIES
jgi:hypothetical protein